MTRSLSVPGQRDQLLQRFASKAREGSLQVSKVLETQGEIIVYLATGGFVVLLKDELDPCQENFTSQVAELLQELSLKGINPYLPDGTASNRGSLDADMKPLDPSDGLVQRKIEHFDSISAAAGPLCVTYCPGVPSAAAYGSRQLRRYDSAPVSNSTVPGHYADGGAASLLDIRGLELDECLLGRFGASIQPRIELYDSLKGDFMSLNYASWECPRSTEGSGLLHSYSAPLDDCLPREQYREAENKDDKRVSGFLSNVFSFERLLENASESSNSEDRNGASHRASPFTQYVCTDDDRCIDSASSRSRRVSCESVVAGSSATLSRRNSFSTYGARHVSSPGVYSVPYSEASRGDPLPRRNSLGGPDVEPKAKNVRFAKDPELRAPSVIIVSRNRQDRAVVARIANLIAKVVKQPQTPYLINVPSKPAVIPEVDNELPPKPRKNFTKRSKSMDEEKRKQSQKVVAPLPAGTSARAGAPFSTRSDFPLNVPSAFPQKTTVRQSEAAPPGTAKPLPVCLTYGGMCISGSKHSLYVTRGKVETTQEVPKAAVQQQPIPCAENLKFTTGRRSLHM